MGAVGQASAGWPLRRSAPGAAEVFRELTLEPRLPEAGPYVLGTFRGAARPPAGGPGV
jgi:hypothetical protein